MKENDLSNNGQKNGVNPFDAIAARIVSQAIPADKMPSAARNAVRKALNAAGMKPEPQSPDPAEAKEATNRAATALVDAMGKAQAMVLPDPVVQRAARRIERHQEGLVLVLAQERTPNGWLLPLDLDDLGDQLQGFDYPPSVTAPGYREYELGGKPLVRFYSPEVAFEDGDMLVNLRYRIQA